MSQLCRGQRLDCRILHQGVQSLHTMCRDDLRLPGERHSDRKDGAFDFKHYSSGLFSFWLWIARALEMTQHSAISAYSWAVRHGAQVMYKRYLTKCLLKGSTRERLRAFEPRWVRQPYSWSSSKQHSWSLSSITGGTECRDQGLSAVAVEEMERRIIYTNLHKDWCLTCDAGETLKFLAAFCTSLTEALTVLFSQQLHHRSG